ncbi:DMT family transporter [Pseudotabrizicola sp. L79]|uniref:DMT family transporter n=1 Tax=Pseudotabrizicola sp. L79 TaxID=3118402 RepID=UPI002F941BE9
MNPTLTGILLALGGSLTLSINDVAIKFLSGDYPLHEVILVRAVIGLVFLAGLIRLSGQSFRLFRTQKPLDHLIRVSIVMVSNVTYFLGLAAMPLADAVAVAYVSPLIVTLLSVVLLGESVGPRRWAAVSVGMIGVLIMLRPGSGVIQPAAILVLISAFCYASSHMMTRRMRATESAITLSFYVQCGFVLVSCTMGLVVGDGKFAGSANPSLAFLFRPWVWPALTDLPAFLATGVAVAVGGLMVSQAYRLCEAGLIAPFEYAGMPMAIFWGVMIFGTWPDMTAWAGIALICGAGLYTLYRETRRRQETRFDTRSGRV